MVKTLVPIDHESNADGNFLSQYENSPQFIGFVKSYLDSLNLVEDELTLFKSILQLQTAEGFNLTQWGIILQASTRPVSDDEFRVLLFALIGAYYSEGRPEDIRALIVNMVSATTYTFKDIGGAIFGFEVTDAVFTFDTDLISDFVGLAKPAGVEFEGLTLVLSDYLGFDLDAAATAYGLITGFTSVTGFTNYVFPTVFVGSVTQTVNTAGTVTFTIIQDAATGAAFKTELDTHIVGAGQIGNVWGIVDKTTNEFYVFEVIRSDVITAVTITTEHKIDITISELSDTINYFNIFKEDATLGLQNITGSQMVVSFTNWLDTDGAAFATNNPNGITKTVAETLSGGGFYSVIIE